MPDDDTTHDLIETAILASLDRLVATDAPPDRLIRWSKVRQKVPGTPSQQTEALNRLWETWRINLMKVNGTVYLWPADELDEREKAHHAAHGLRRDQEAALIIDTR